MLAGSAGSLDSPATGGATVVPAASAEVAGTVADAGTLLVETAGTRDSAGAGGATVVTAAGADVAGTVSGGAALLVEGAGVTPGAAQAQRSKHPTRTTTGRAIRRALPSGAVASGGAERRQQGYGRDLLLGQLFPPQPR